MAGSLSGFNIGVSGLRTSAGAIDVVSTNIANANTVGFKGADYLFVDQYFRSLSSADVGRAAQGTSETSVTRSFNQGALRNTGSSLDLAITGQGFFRLASRTGSDAGLIYYTRNGQFSVDKDGYIVNATGLYLTGYTPNARGDGVTNNIGPIALPPSQKAPLATAEGTLNVNLDSRSEIKKAAGEDTPKPFDPDDDTTFAHSTAMGVYDGTGNKSTVKVYYRRVADAAASFQDATNTATEKPVESYKVYFSITDVDGNTRWLKNQGTTEAPDFETVKDEKPTGVAVDDSDTDAFAMVFKDSDPAKNRLTLNFFEGKNTDSIYRDKKTGESVNKTRVSFVITTGEDAAARNEQQITLDLTETSRYSQDFEVKDLSQDGYPVGSLNSISFNESGVLYGIYSNGQRLIAGQASMARFKSEAGLSLVAQNLFAESVSSGEALLGVAGSGSMGVVRNSTLEEANVDMASELVKLMIQQRNYQANSQSIRAQDEILQSTIGLAR